MELELNFVEVTVLWIILICCVISGVDSFVNYVCPLSIQEQRVQLEPLMQAHRAAGLANERGGK